MTLQVAAIVVSGALANKPRNGGEAWVRLNYVLGLARLGCDVRFVEEIDLQAATDDGLAYFDTVTEEFALAAPSLVRADGLVLRGPALDELLAAAAETDLLLNISGNLTLEPLFSRFRRRAYVDLDPGYTQLWRSQGHSVGRLDEHDVHFSVGVNVGRPSWELPDAGVAWHPTLPPVVLEEWPWVSPPEAGRFTTVASWRGSYGRVEHDGVLYGQKAHEFRRFAQLPGKTRASFELALAIDSADASDRRLLEEQGWRVVDAVAVADTPHAFRRYVQASGGEFAAAQGIYVATCSGWFSDRSARYLASGRPAVVQETGLRETVPVGAGLLTFSRLEEAVAAIEHVCAHYEEHCAAARSFAEAELDSDRVLARMLEVAGVRG
jgi:hypothetical protein